MLPAHGKPAPHLTHGVDPVTVTVWSVPTRLRPLASGMAQVAGHVLGDVPSPPLVGLLQGVPRPAAMRQVTLLSMVMMAGPKAMLYCNSQWLLQGVHLLQVKHVRLGPGLQEVQGAF